MRKFPSIERRSDAARTASNAMVFPGAMPRQRVWALVAVWLCLTTFGNVATGPEVWFGPFYLMAIGFAAWMLGRREAVAVGLATLVLVISANGLDLYPVGTAAALWNLGMRVITVLMFIGLLGHVRESFAREWRLARVDPLTGAFNRQAYFELAARPSTSRDWVMLAYADLDGLKQLNDQHGHAAGDRALVAYVAHVRSVIRRCDHFARLGGDEFVVQAKVRDEAAAKMLAGRIHREMNAAAALASPDLKCSVGVLILPCGNRMADREVLAADQLMYEAKQQGAGLVVATLQEVRGSEFLLQHCHLSSGIESNPVVADQFNRVKWRKLDTAA